MQPVSVPNYAAIEAAVARIKQSLIAAGQHVRYEAVAAMLQEPEHARSLHGASLDAVPAMRDLMALENRVTTFIQAYTTSRCPGAWDLC
jgi:hypothetical protein